MDDEDIIHQKWKLGVQHRGLDHWSYAVCREDGYPILQSQSERICDHIVVLHNQFVDDYISEMGSLL